MDASSIIDTLTAAVPGASYEAGTSVDFATIYVPAAQLVETCRALRDIPSISFEPGGQLELNPPPQPTVAFQPG